MGNPFKKTTVQHEYDNGKVIIHHPPKEGKHRVSPVTAIKDLKDILKKGK